MDNQKIYLMNIDSLTMHKVGTTYRDVTVRAGELTSRKKAEHQPIAYITINSESENRAKAVETHTLATFEENGLTVVGNDYIITDGISTDTILKNFIKIATDYLKFLNISYTITIL